MAGRSIIWTVYYNFCGKKEKPAADFGMKGWLCALCSRANSVTVFGEVVVELGQIICGPPPVKFVHTPEMIIYIERRNEDRNEERHCLTAHKSFLKEDLQGTTPSLRNRI